MMTVVNIDNMDKCGIRTILLFWIDIIQYTGQDDTVKLLQK